MMQVGAQLSWLWMEQTEWDVAEKNFYIYELENTPDMQVFTT